MSEQVGASLVLAQMLLPSQPGTSNTNATTPGRPVGTPADTGLAPQGIDSVDESGPVFASLLTELTNLTARTEAALAVKPDDLIRIRVATQPAAGAALPTADGSNLPTTGKPLPESLELSPGAGGLSPQPLPAIPTQPPGPDATTAENLADLDIVVPEPTPAPATSATNATSATASQAATASTNPLVGGTEQLNAPAGSGSATSPPATSLAAATASVPPSTAPAPASLDNTVRIEMQPGAIASAGGNTGGANTSGDTAAGGQQQGGRQAQPNGPSITFSLDGLPTATTPAFSLAGATPAAGAGPGLPGTHQLPLALLGQPAQWAEPLAERLAGLATRGANTAEIRLHPPSLGQLEVRITLANDQASIFVASANPEVREALQQALPRLDNLLNGLGIELAESEIAERQADAFQADGDGQSRSSGDGDPAEDGEQRANAAEANRLGLLDTWA